MKLLFELFKIKIILMVGIIKRVSFYVGVLYYLLERKDCRKRELDIRFFNGIYY